MFGTAHKKAIIAYFLLHAVFAIAFITPCFAQDEAPKQPCNSILNLSCDEIVINAPDDSVEVITFSEKRVTLPLAADEAPNDLCPNNQCVCDEDIQYLKFAGKGSGIAKINASELREAKSQRCNVHSDSEQRFPQYVNVEAPFISTATYSLSYCRGCGGSCHGETELKTYDFISGQDYKIKDIIAEKDLPSLREAIMAIFLQQYFEPKLDKALPEEEKEAERQLVKERVASSLSVSSLKEHGIYTENGKVYLNVSTFALSCADGSFFPVEIPQSFIDKLFYKLLNPEVSDTALQSH